MAQNKFDIVHEKLNSIKGITISVENFTHKQTELFEALNSKFPNIEQFSNALKDANELLVFAKNIQSDVDICLEHLEQLQNANNLESQKYLKIGDIKRTLDDISLEFDKINNLDIAKQELLKVGLE
ncbi:MAG: hypothetical protein LBG21_04620 [Campylobacteraceae bacterium]|jgi:uncharacterized protein YoxC|nr:hypothetical protein [Campylobacteraceae bacterium]